MGFIPQPASTKTLAAETRWTVASWQSESPGRPDQSSRRAHFRGPPTVRPCSRIRDRPGTRALRRRLPCKARNPRRGGRSRRAPMRRTGHSGRARVRRPRLAAEITPLCLPTIRDPSTLRQSVVVTAADPALVADDRFDVGGGQSGHVAGRLVERRSGSAPISRVGCRSCQCVQMSPASDVVIAARVASVRSRV
jgi:hypothetical protein